MITTDEELAGRDGISGVHRLTEEGCRAKICWLPDSTAPNWEIERLSKGSWRFNLVAKGKAAHGARPWEGESASFKLIHALHELHSHFEDHGPLTDSLNVGILEGGEAFNQIPTLMTAAVDIRLVDDTSVAINQALLEEICKKYDVSVRTRFLAPPKHQDLDHPLMQAAMDSIERITGRRPQGYISLGGSDAPYLTDVGTPCVLACPQGGGHHSETEWIDRSSFLQFLPILHDFMEHNAKTPATTVDTLATLV
jgi:succinyl-diaminopimelate desuccinylase